MAQNEVVIFGVLLLLAALLLFLHASGRKSSARLWNRSFLMGIAGFASIVLGLNGSILWPRAFVVVYPADMDLQPDSLWQLLEFVDQADRADRVTFLRLCSTNTPPAGSLSRFSWFHVSDLSRRSLPDLVKNNAVSLVGGPLSWPQDVDEAVERALAQRPLAIGRKPRDSALVLFKPGPVWTSFDVSGNSISNVVSRIAATGPREYFVIRADAHPPGQIFVDVSGGFLPASIPVQNAYIKLVFRLESIPAPADGKYKLTVQLDKESKDLVMDQAAVSNPPPSIGGLPYLTTNLVDCVSDPTQTLIPGFHRIEVTMHLVVSDAAGNRSLTYHTVRYIEAETRSLLVLYPKVGLGQLGDEGWSQHYTTSLTTNAAAMLRHLYDNVDRQLDFQVRAGTVSLKTLNYKNENDPAWKEIATEARASSALAIVEPSINDISALEGALAAQNTSMKDLIRNGLNVMVVGPPAQSNQVPWPSWLPASARSIQNGTHPLYVHRDPRIYCLMDNSRPMWFLAARDGAASIIEEQAALVQEVFASFGQTNQVLSLQDGPHVVFPNQGRVPVNAYELNATTPGLYSPLLLHGDFRTGAVLNRRGDEKNLALADLGPGSMSARIKALCQDVSEKRFGPAFRRIVQDDDFRATAIILFVSDLPDVNPALESLTVGPSRTESETLKSGTYFETIDDLVKAGVRVYVVRVRTGDIGTTYATTTGLSTQPSMVGAVTNLQNSPLELECPPGYDAAAMHSQAQSLAHLIVADIKSHPALEMQLSWGGRVFDDRVMSSRPAPHLALELEPVTNTVFSPNAIISNPDTRRGQNADSSAVVTTVIGDGSVSALAYSPLACDMWMADAAREAKDWDYKMSGKSPIDGWGIQRFIDLSGISGWGGNLSACPVLGSVEEFGDNSGVQFTFWSRFSKDTDIGGQKIVFAQTNAVCSLVDARPSDRKIISHYRADKPIAAGFYPVIAGADEPQSKRKAVFLHLQPAPPSGESAWDTLTLLSSLSGGSVVDSSTSKEPIDKLRYRYPCSRLAALLLILVALGLFSPAAHTWSGFRVWLRKFRRPDPLSQNAGSLMLSLRGTFVEFGLAPGTPAAIRQAGLPGGQRPFELGDALAAAKPASLIGFTSIGRRIKLPPRLPLMRLKHANQATEAVIILDCSPSMFIPSASRWATKVQYASALAGLLAGHVWLKGGYVRLGSTSGALLDPVGPGSDPGDLERSIQALFHSGTNKCKNYDTGSRSSVGGLIPNSDEVSSGATFFLISDLMQFEREHLAKEGKLIVDAEAQLRVLHVVDPEELQLAGFGRTGWTIQDRTDWTSEDITAAYNARAHSMRNTVERGGGIFVTLSTSDTLATSFERMNEQEVLG